MSVLAKVILNDVISMSHFGAPLPKRWYFYALGPIQHTLTHFSILFSICPAYAEV